MMAFSVCDNSDSPQVTAADNHDDVSQCKLDKLSDFARFQVELYCVIDFDERVWVPDGSAIVSYNTWDTLGSYTDTFNATQLKLKRTLPPTTLSLNT